MRKLVCVVLAAACGGGGSDTPRDGGLDTAFPDAPDVAPTITSFVATPSTIAANTPTAVTWTWTYGLEPTLPEPACTIDRGVGPVTRGQPTLVTLAAVTTFTLTCTNIAGMAQRQVVVAIPPAAPQLATFTATPNALAVGAATNVTWSFTFSNTPSPAPTCTIEHGIGTVTDGTASSITQTTTRTYRLRCANSVGSSFRDVTIGVDECAAGTHDCGPNSTCNNTLEAFSCTCNTGFVATPNDTCSSLQACTLGQSGGACDANATCLATGQGNACMCNPGFTGDGSAANGCQRNRIAFVTSTTGTGNLSTWPGAGGQSGLAAADNVCQSLATTAGLAGTYRAWLSDATTDAYCRAHGLTGTKAASCGQAALPVAAGPWVRRDGQPFAPRIDRLLAPTRQLFLPTQNENGVAITSTTDVFTGTDDNGVAVANTCASWTSSSAAVAGARGDANGGGGGAWTDANATDPGCAALGRLRCIEVVDATTQGPPLPARHPIARRVFVTSVTGNGQMSTWPDAAGTNGILGADEVCKARARFAGYTNAGAFEALLSTGTVASSRIASSSAWVRPDGMPVATSRTDLIDNTLGAAISQTETGAYLPGAADAGGAWSGTAFSGSSMFATGSSCSSWTSTAVSGTVGRHDLTDGRWMQAVTPGSTATCTTAQRLYCYED